MELAITLIQPHKRTELFGAGDRYLRRIRDTLEVRIDARGNAIRVNGDATNVAKAGAVFERLQKRLKKQDYLVDEDVDHALAEIAMREAGTKPGVLTGFSGGAIVEARTPGQRQYVDAMLSHDLTFCLGPAGTGKTYLAVAVAAHLLKSGQIKRIALVRPAVEAGEKLGFLPGDLQQKVNPYLRPLFDAMHDMMSFEQLKRFMVSDIVEVIPLAYMRGRTLNNAVIILDEAQNTTTSQMLMFLTRLGNHSRMIVTGDDSQVDLESGQRSGLRDAVHKLHRIEGIAIVHLSDSDIVRHRLVQRIVNQYAQTTPPLKKNQTTSDNTAKETPPKDPPPNSD
jgi:phosphate starvation-inducible PhoH-like protein